MGEYKRAPDYAFERRDEAYYFCEEVEQRIQAHGLLSIACVEKILNYNDLYQSDLIDHFIGWIPSMLSSGLKIQRTRYGYEVHLGRPVRLLSKRLFKRRLEAERRMLRRWANQKKNRNLAT